MPNRATKQQQLAHGDIARIGALKSTPLPWTDPSAQHSSSSLASWPSTSAMRAVARSLAPQAPATTTITTVTTTRASRSSVQHSQAQLAAQAYSAAEETQAHPQATFSAAVEVRVEGKEARSSAAALLHHNLKPAVNRSRSLARRQQGRVEAVHRPYSVALAQTRIKAVVRRRHLRALHRQQAASLAERATQQLVGSRIHL